MCCARSVARKVLCALCATHCAVRWAREPEASVRRRCAGESAASRLAGRCGCVVCARVMSRRRVMLRIGRRAKWLAHNVRRAWCAAHRAGRSARGPEASARRRRAEGGPLRHGALARRGARACGWVPRARRGAHRLRTVRCGRRASWRRVRGGGGLGGSLRRGLRGVRGAGSEREATAGREPTAPRRVGCFWLCVRASDEQTARDVAVRSAREADGAQRVACVVCCAPCGAVGTRAGSECEAAAG